MARESTLWDWLKNNTPKWPLHMSRVENLVSRAYPDVEGVAQGSAFWLETKVLQKLRKDGSAGTIKFEPGQREWGQARWNAGGAAYALVGSGRRVFLIPGLFLPSLPERGVVTNDELAARCIICTTGLLSAMEPRRDVLTAEAVFSYLNASSIARKVGEGIAARHPDWAREVQSPTQDLIRQLVDDDKPDFEIA